MEGKSSAYYQRLYRQRLREQGLIKKEVWILPEHAQVLASMERKLRQPRWADLTGMEDEDMGATSKHATWTAPALLTALSTTALVQSGRAAAEMVQGDGSSSLHITMREYGDLPLFMAVSGEQIVVEALLWPADDVADPAVFNERVLHSQSLFALSNIGMCGLPDGKVYYLMFGALSASSSLANVVEEIEVLADNVIRATEAFESFLKSSARTPV